MPMLSWSSRAATTLFDLRWKSTSRSHSSDLSSSNSLRLPDLVVYVPPVDFEFVELLPGFSRSFFSDRSKRLRSGASTISAATDNLVVLDLTELTGAEFARLLAADGFHLNESGSAALADEIAAVVASRLSEQP